MKGNYLWPAMWAPRAFAADDPQNMVLADAMGVVMGNSHHEPMLRAHDEWHRDTAGGFIFGAGPSETVPFGFFNSRPIPFLDLPLLQRTDQ